MHVLRDCEITLAMWESVVDPNLWHSFAGLDLEAWLLFNLWLNSMDNLQWRWPISFASMVHLLWIDHNHFAFSGKSSMPDAFLPKVFGQVEAIQTHLVCPIPSFIDASFEVSVQWRLPPLGVFKLNTDGSFQNGMAACGGLIQNSHGLFIRGFHCNLGSASVVLVELWGLTLGLRMARSMVIASILVELDSQVIVHMIRTRRTHCAHLQPLLAEALGFMEVQDWHCSISHIFREVNFCVDKLAELGHLGSFQWTVLEIPPASLSLALAADLRGVSSLRLVH